MPPRNKAALMDLVARIVTLYETEKKSFKEIESILREEGLDVSKSSIHRAYKDHVELAADYKKLAVETKELMESLKTNPTTDMMDAVIAIITNRLFQSVRVIESMEFEDPAQLAYTVDKIAKSAEKLNRFRANQLKKTADKLEEEGQKRNIDPEFIKMMKQQIYGIQ
jgi:hypothetical protein